jgi:hypothetical protein
MAKHHAADNLGGAWQIHQLGTITPRSA